MNPNSDPRFRDYWQEYYALVQRKGISIEYAKREVTRRTTLIGALMVRRGDADAMLCGTIAQFSLHVDYIANVIGLRKGATQFAAMNMLILPTRTLFICDTYVNPDPTAEQVAEIAMMAAEEVARFGIVPKIGAAVAFQLRQFAPSFGAQDEQGAGNPRAACAAAGSGRRDARRCRARRGNPPADIPELAAQGRSEPADHAHAGCREHRVQPAQDLRGRRHHGGPILLGAAKPVHILTPTATVRRLVNMAALASVDASFSR